MANYTHEDILKEYNTTTEILEQKMELNFILQGGWPPCVTTCPLYKFCIAGELTDLTLKGKGRYKVRGYKFITLDGRCLYKFLPKK